MTANWHLTVDCADSSRLVAFWCAALGYVPEPAPDGWDSWLAYWRAAGISDEELEGAEDGSGAIVDPEGVRPRIWFQEVPEPKSVKNRLHIDLKAGGGRDAVPWETRWPRVEAEVARLTAAGATVVRTYDMDGRPDHVLMADPEGNEFCVV